MRFRSLFSAFVAALALASLALSSGCSNDDDADGRSYNDIGETRVFDAPGQTARANGCSGSGNGECVPAPAPIVEAPRAEKREKRAMQTERLEKTAHKSHLDVAASPRHKFQMIGEMDMDE